MKIHYIKLPEEPKGGTLESINHKGKYHDPNKVITYSFIGGADAHKGHVRQGIQKLLNAVPGLKIQEVAQNGDVRISFNPNLGSWSYVGTDIYRIPKNVATMNIGWFESTHRVVMHEWLHTLNFSHEHIRGINWNKPKVYAYFAKIGWTKAMVDNNLFVDDLHHYDYTEIDNDSIMKYYIPCELTLDNKNCGERNVKLSQQDIKRLNELFPYTEEPDEPEDPDTGGDDDETDDEITIEDMKKFLSNLFTKKSDLDRLLESQVVHIAQELGIEATKDDLKADTIERILKELST